MKKRRTKLTLRARIAAHDRDFERMMAEFNKTLADVEREMRLIEHQDNRSAFDRDHAFDEWDDQASVLFAITYGYRCEDFVA